MNARSTSQLGDTLNACFYLFGSYQHQIRQLVDNDYNPRKRTQPLFRMCFYVGIIAGDIPYTGHREQLIAVVHHCDNDLQCAVCLIPIRYHRSQQMRYLLIRCELHLLRVDQQQLDLIRSGAHQNRGDDGIDTDRLSTSCRTGNQ